MILSFKTIDNHLQRQLLKLLKYAEDEQDTKRAIYLGYGVIRNHLMDIIEKIRDYYRYHEKINTLYSINDMFIPGTKPRFIIPSLSDDIYGTLGSEIESYLNGFDTLIGIDVSNYQVLNDLYHFKEHFAKMCYNSIYYALKEYGSSNFTGINLLLDTINKSNFFNNQKIGIIDIPSIFDFDRRNNYLFCWNDYINKYSLSHKEFKKLQRLNRGYYDPRYEDEEILSDNSYDGLSGDQMFRKYVEEMLIEEKDVKKKFKDNMKELMAETLDEIEEDVESDNEGKKSKKKDKKKDKKKKVNKRKDKKK